MDIMVDFSKFILSPEYFANLLSIVTEAITDFMLLINNVVSSANWQIRNSSFICFIPQINRFSLICIANISATRMNSNTEIGHPCLTPRLRLNSWDRYPLFVTQDSIFLCRS